MHFLLSNRPSGELAQLPTFQIFTNPPDRFPTCPPDRLQAALPNLIAQSERLAREGQISEAIEGFAIVKKWKPDWAEDPKAYAEKLAKKQQ